MTITTDQHWKLACDALEEMIDAADDAWEAEQKGSISRRNSIKESRYEPAKNRLRDNIDAYVDARIKAFIMQHTNAKLVTFTDDVIIER